MKKKYAIIATMLFVLNFYAQRSDVDYYLNLKKMNIGQFEESLSLNNWNFEKTMEFHDYTKMFGDDYIENKTFIYSYLNQFTGESNSEIKIKKFESNKKESEIDLVTTDLDFHKGFLLNLRMMGFSIINSFVGKEYNYNIKIGKKVYIDPIVTIYSDGIRKVKITTQKVGIVTFYTSTTFNYSNIKTEYVIEF